MPDIQPEALRLANLLNGLDHCHFSQMDEAAEELRRLHESNQVMLEALKIAKEKLLEIEHEHSGGDDEIYVEGAILTVCAAITKGEQV